MSKVQKTKLKTGTTSKQLEFELKARVQELEQEVKNLKCKLDELRKAKNTTVIKKEKEFVTTGIPQRHHDSHSSKNLNSNTNDEDSLSEIKKSYQQEIDKLTTELQKLSSQPKPERCNHEEIITALQMKLAETESLNTALSMECSQLEERLSQAYGEISKKEAEHCEQQEKMKTELQKKWQEMYKEWMKTTEAKIAELQAANNMMRGMLGARPNP